jgi:ferredoxin
MIEIAGAAITAGDIKAKARELGADLVGIADGAAMDANPPDASAPRRPCDITDHDGGRAIVLAKRFQSGATRLPAWNDRNKQFTDELTVNAVAEIALDLVYWLDDQGHPALAIPPTFLDPSRYDSTLAAPPAEMLSARHAAVEAGMGTLGLNLQLLTPEFGPRVVLAIVLTSADVEPDRKRQDALCLGPQCGRCLSACPADAVRHWERDWAACNKYREPNGFHRLAGLLTDIVRETDIEEQAKLIQSRPSSEMFDAMLHRVGIVSGCRRCFDVCPVGADYEESLKAHMDEIPEASARKTAALADMAAGQAKGEFPPALGQYRRWIGKLANEMGG